MIFANDQQIIYKDILIIKLNEQDIFQKKQLY